MPHSLGSLYTMICEFIGYGKYGDRGRSWGSASRRDAYADTFNDMIRLTKDGMKLNPAYFLPFGSNQGMSIDESGEMIIHRHFSERIVELFGEPRKRGSERITTRDNNLAHSLQVVFERVHAPLAHPSWHGPHRQDRSELAGGCVPNSVANGRCSTRPPSGKPAFSPLLEMTVWLSVRLSM